MLDRRSVLSPGLLQAAPGCSGGGKTAARLTVGFQRNGVPYIAQSRGELATGYWPATSPWNRSNFRRDRR